MLGELNVSHSGARYSRVVENADETASLGAFYDTAYKGPGYRILEVMAGGPLDKAGLEVKAGSVIEPSTAWKSRLTWTSSAISTGKPEKKSFFG